MPHGPSTIDLREWRKRPDRAMLMRVRGEAATRNPVSGTEPGAELDRATFRIRNSADTIPAWALGISLLAAMEPRRAVEWWELSE